MFRLPILLTGVVLALMGFVAGYYSYTCPTCTACVQVEQQTVRQEQAAPALAATAKATDREAALQREIADIKAQAAQRPPTRTITIVKEVPAECTQHVQRQAQADASACLEQPDIDLINRARGATME